MKKVDKNNQTHIQNQQKQKQKSTKKQQNWVKTNRNGYNLKEFIQNISKLNQAPQKLDKN